MTGSMSGDETAPELGAGENAAICSAKGCRSDAHWVLVWNNPRVHTPQRRKTWVACQEHREYLSAFLGARGFLQEVVPLADWPG